MPSEMTKAVYRLVLKSANGVTAAGAAYCLRDEFTPIPVMSETEASLEWLAHGGYVTRHPDAGFGVVYKREREVR